MTILLTGITGFIGSHVAAELCVRFKCTIIAPVRNLKIDENRIRHSTPGINFKQGSFYQKELLNTIFRNNSIDYVIHLAAIRGNGKGNLEDYQMVNVKATEVLLDYAWRHQVKRFIYCSSVGVWGTIPSDLPPDESTPLIGDGLYHQSKMEAERLVSRFIEKGLDTIIIRPTITYGKGDDGFPARLIELVKHRLFIMPKREVKIHLVSVKKVAELFALCVDKNNSRDPILLAIDKEPIALKKLADLIYHHFYGKPYPKSFQFPDFIFSCGKWLCKVTRNDTWNTRLKLISNDWYYRKLTIDNESDFEAEDTELGFIKHLNTLTDKNEDDN